MLWATVQHKRLREGRSVGESTGCVSDNGGGKGCSKCCELQCNHKRLREGRSVGESTGCVSDNAGGKGCSKCCELQCNHKRLREGWSVAESTGFVSDNARGKGCSQCHELQCHHKRLREGRSVAESAVCVSDNARGKGCSKCCELQCNHKRLREGRSVAESTGFVSDNARGKGCSKCFLLRGGHECFREGWSMAAIACHVEFDAWFASGRKYCNLQCIVWLPIHSEQPLGYFSFSRFLAVSPWYHCTWRARAWPPHSLTGLYMFDFEVVVGHDSEKHVAREEVADMSYRDRLGENTGSLGHFGFASHSPWDVEQFGPSGKESRLLPERLFDTFCCIDCIA